AGPGRVLLLSALAGLGACGGPAKSASGPVVTPSRPDRNTSNGQATDGQQTDGQETPGEESPLPSAVVQASGIGASESEAYEQALTMLETEVYGDDPWARDSGLAVHDPDQDLIHREEAAGKRVRVLLGLERERLDGLLQELASQPMPASVPPSLSQALASPHGMYMEALACERRLELLDEPCEGPRREDIAAELQALAREVRLRTRLTGGVPLDGENRPLRPLEIVAERVSARGAITPLAGVPLVLVQADVDAESVPKARTDQTGVARFALPDGETWSSDTRVALDVEAFLGPLAEMWPQNALAPPARQATIKRWSVVVTERVQGSQARQPIFAASLDRAMRAAGGDPMVALPVEAMRKITTATPATLPRVLPVLADELQGRLDVLVVAELDSEYASRMGAYRVWYEARVRVQVYDVWTGKRLTELQDAVTATGVGDERADQAARAQLAEKLATELAKVPPVIK
ncbi:MAG TPA: hypothetical protein VNM90_15175, partial [Haliangium sp.]|nr:hypothetical protein [Haliangium sp.]